MAIHIPLRTKEEFQDLFQSLPIGQRDVVNLVTFSGRAIKTRAIGKHIFFAELQSIHDEDFLLQLCCSSDTLRSFVGETLSQRQKDATDAPCSSNSDNTLRNECDGEQSGGVSCCCASQQPLEEDPNIFRNLRLNKRIKVGSQITVVGFVERTQRGPFVLNALDVVEIISLPPAPPPYKCLNTKLERSALPKETKGKQRQQNSDTTIAAAAATAPNKTEAAPTTTTTRVLGAYGTNVPTLCKNFKKQGFCDDEQEPGSCQFRHYFISAAEEEAAMKIRAVRIKTLERVREQAEDDPHDESDKQYSSRRAILFTEWLVSTFTKERLREGSGVLDVAGGKGNISFELSIKQDVPSTVIDPRPPRAKLPRSQSKAIKKKKKGIEKDTGLGSNSSDGESTAATVITEPPRHLQAEFNLDEFLTIDEANAHLVQNCSVLIGMHPDQATEAIVDMALKYNKGFACLPCCVFPHLFPHRRLRSGKEVTTYQAFVEYLLEKDPSIQVCYLPFKGRNKCLYRVVP